MAPLIFLGGTAGNSSWRTPFIAELVKAGVPEKALFNPVVADWNAESQAAEDAAKAVARFNLFYLTDPRQDGNPISVYGMVEAIMGLYDRPGNTVVVFDNTGYTDHALKALQKAEADLRTRFPAGYIFGSGDEAVRFFMERLAPPQE